MNRIKTYYPRRSGILLDSSDLVWIQTRRERRPPFRFFLRMTYYPLFFI